MGKINIKNGTPIGSTSVCESCCYAQVMRGFRESEMLVYCNFPTPTILVPFKLSACTNHYDKNRPSWKQMQDLAIQIAPATAKPAGFRRLDSSNDVDEEESITINE